MKKLKVMSVVGTRPEIIRLSRVLAALDRYCDHVLVHTGQNYDYELNQIFFDDLGIRKPDYFLNAAGGNAAETIGNIIGGALLVGSAYTYVNRVPRRRGDRFIWIALIAAALAVAAIAFGYLREAKDREIEMQYLEQPADTHTAASGDAAQPEQPITE